MNYMDRHKIEVVEQVANGSQSVHWAAAKLNRSVKTIKRYVSRIMQNPEDDLIHKNRGKTPKNRVDHETIWRLYKEKYAEHNILFFCEKLEELENIKVSEATVRTIFKENDEVSVGSWHRTRNKLRKRLRSLKKLTVEQKDVLIQLEAEPYVGTVHPTQPRCKYFGEEFQMDACDHLWFGDKKSQLHIAIDDATGKIVGGFFDSQETRNGYYNVTRQFVTEYGIPIKIKTDKRTVFEYERKKKKDLAEDTMTQYQQVCRTFGIELECSSVPQFKPRVERSFRTLQGRLPFELKRAHATTLEQANEFLNFYIKKFNERFAITDGIESCLSSQPSKDQIDRTLVTFAKRVVDQGNGIRINNKYYGTFDSYGNQVFISPRTSVSVITMMDNSVFALHGGKLLALCEIPARQKFSKDVDSEYEIPVPCKKYIPPFDHPWRITNENFFKKNSAFY